MTDIARRGWIHSWLVVAKPATLLVVWGCLGMVAVAQPAKEDATESVTPPKSEIEETEAPERVAVEPLAEDGDIAGRLLGILEATDWFTEPNVTVDEGVVFLEGRADLEEQRKWAGDLARRTEDVVAVVNRIKVPPPSPLDVGPAKAELDRLAREAVRLLPAVVIAGAVLALTYVGVRIAHRIASFVASRRVESTLLRQMIARIVAVPVAILGIFLALRVSGLTGLAATVLGGTGLLGLVVGIAFRDIAENYLASLLISMKRPFRMGDLILVDGKKGFVQSVTTRGTLLMTLDGNHIQIPNSIIYKNVIHNFTANPKTRFEFIVGIDYADKVARAQEAILTAVQNHDAVVPDPEPLVLVDALAASTVNLRVWFWVDTDHYSGLKVRSAVIRRVKQALEDEGLTLPDEAREVIFPRGVPVKIQQEDPIENNHVPKQNLQPDRNALAPESDRNEREPLATRAEGDLSNEREEVQRQAAATSPPDQGENLLEAS